MVPECVASLEASFRALESLESLAMLPSEAQGRRALYDKHMGRRSCRVDERRYSVPSDSDFCFGSPLVKSGRFE